MADPMWYVNVAGEQKGPMSTGELRGMLARGQVGPSDMVWREGMTEWTPAGSVPELQPPAPAAAPGRAPAPPPPAAVMWHVSRGGQQFGPFSTDDVRAKLATGELTAADFVWKEGMAGWAAIGGLPDFASAGPFAASPPPAPGAPYAPFAPPRPSPVGTFFKDFFAGGTEEEPVSTPAVSLVEKVLSLLRFLKGRPEGFQRYQRLLIRVGCLSLLAAGIVWLLHNTIGAIRQTSFGAFLTGLGWVLGAIVLHYVAAKFGNAGQEIIAADVHTMSSKAFMDCLGLVAALGAIGALVSGVIDAINARAFSPLLPMLVGCALLAHLALFCLNPKECLNIEHDPRRARAGETALAILTFAYRCVLVVTPVVLGAGAAASTVWMAFSMIGTWGANPMASEFTFDVATQLVVAAGLAPLLAYVVYLLAMLGVEIALAIFRIARNTEPSAKEDKE